MAHVDCVVDVVSLALDHADAVVELGRDAVGLVCGDAVFVDEGGVVRAYLCDVSVGAVAELGPAIAGGGVCGCGRGRGAGAGCG